MRKILNVGLMCLLVFVLAGCGESERNQRIDNMKFAAWDNCVKQGGVPLGAWWDSRTLADCKFKPTEN